MSEMNEDGEVAIKIITNQGNTKEKSYDKWEIEDWCHTLQKAEEIKADPEKMALIKPKLEQKVKAMKSMADLRKIASKKIAESEYQSGSVKEGGLDKKDKQVKKDVIVDP